VTGVQTCALPISFGGNPLVCATALAVIKTITDDALAANATAMGQL